MEQESPALANFLDDCFSETCCLRHDGRSIRANSAVDRASKDGGPSRRMAATTVNFINFAPMKSYFVGFVRTDALPTSVGTL